MQDSFKSNLFGLVERIKKLSFKRDDTGVLMAYAQSSKIDSKFRDVAAEIAALARLKAAYLCINIIPPGVRVPEHTDALKPYEKVLKFKRYHLPVLTNLDCKIKDFDGERHMPVGFWTGPIKYWEPHSTWNNGKVERIHVVVDLY